MSVTGPGCEACDFEGCKPLDPAYPFSLVPCLTCSPWRHADDFPGADLRAKAAAILDAPGTALPRMVAWAKRLTTYAAEVDADRAHALAQGASPC